ncbi:hypothetical protein D3C85_1707050 [compost metagenome]
MDRDSNLTARSFRVRSISPLSFNFSRSFARSCMILFRISVLSLLSESRLEVNISKECPFSSRAPWKAAPSVHNLDLNIASPFILTQIVDVEEYVLS